MVRIRGLVAVLVAAMTVFINCATRAEDNSKEIQALQQDIETLRRQLRESNQGGVRSTVDKALESKYGPGATVTTKTGKLVVGGLIQVWYTGIQNDTRGLFDDKKVNTVQDTNEAQDNDSFRVRYAEIKFTMDIHENVSAVVMIDPAREANSFPDLPHQQGLFKRANQVAPEYDNLNGPGLGDTSSVQNVQFGGGIVPRLLQDAYINYHGVVPHHDFTIGQFVPKFGEEGVRSDAQLDFAERSFVGKIGNSRDMGVQIHGSWWDKECGCESTGEGRLQYWLGAFNGTGNYYLSAGPSYNRSDDNSQKDFLQSVLVRPLWKHDTWGSLELGGSSEFGTHGESGGRDPIANPVNGLNRKHTFATRFDAFASYAPGTFLKGWWLRGEWQRLQDRNAPGTVVDLTGNGGTDIGNFGTGSGMAQSNGKPFASRAWTFSTGYKVSESAFVDCNMWYFLKPMEFTFRYDEAENIQIADPVRPDHTDVFRTRIYTVGMNYYIKGHNAKIQGNYNFVNEPSGLERGGLVNFHNVKNDNFIISFQVAF